MYNCISSSDYRSYTSDLLTLDINLHLQENRVFNFAWTDSFVFAADHVDLPLYLILVMRNDQTEMN